MSISSTLNNALSGLNATARMAEVVSSNLSNALTEGYGRRSVELSAAEIGGVGAGVRVETINRFVDSGLLADRRLADSGHSGQDRTATMVMRLEQALGGPDDASGLGPRLAAFEASLISASSDPASQTRLSTAVSRLQDVAATLNANSREIQSLRQDADAAIAQDIAVLNRSLQQVAELNSDIMRVKATGNDPSALMDARQKTVDQIATIVPIREIPRDNGTIRLMTANGTNLLDSRPVAFAFDPTPTITADMTLASGALGGITVDGLPIDPATGVGRLDGGSLGAAFALRDKTLVETQTALDTVAADLIARFQDPANDPTLAAGDPGLLTDEGGVLDLSDLPGLAGRITVNPAILPSEGGDAALLRDGLNAVGPRPAGNPTQINTWIAALATPRADVPGSPEHSAMGRIGIFVADVSTTRVVAEEKLSFTAARRDTLFQAELANGVDTDVELQTLLRVEQAYAANARVIQTVDFMMQRLMEI